MFRQLTRWWGMSAAIAASSVMLMPSCAMAKHFTKFRYVRAYKECTPETANTVTGAGVPACSPPKLLSDCADDPVSAMNLGPRGGGRVSVRAFGRLASRVAGKPDIRTRFKFRDLRHCSDQTPVSAELTAQLSLRLAIKDDACGGLCTVPDFSIDYPIPVDGKSVKLNIDATNQEILLPNGQTPIPDSRPWDAKILSFYILDPAGNPFLAPGIFVGSAAGAAKNIPVVRARSYEIKPAETSAECMPEDATFNSTDGFDACAGVRLSDCDGSPDTALIVGLRKQPETDGGTRQGAWKMKTKRRGPPEATGRGVLMFVDDCSTGGRYVGPLDMEFVLRVTYHDGACDGSACTPIDKTARMQFDMDHARADFKPSLASLLAAAGLPPLSVAAPATVEFLELKALDKAGNPFAISPGMRLACNPRTGFCFGI